MKSDNKRDKAGKAYSDGISGGMYAQLAGGGAIQSEPKDNKRMESGLGCKSGFSSDCPGLPVEQFTKLGSGHKK